MAMLSPAFHKKFLDLACALSPENLSCDGMASPSQMKRRSREINTQWVELEAQVGRKVSEQEVWDTLIEQEKKGWT